MRVGIPPVAGVIVPRAECEARAAPYLRRTGRRSRTPAPWMRSLSNRSQAGVWLIFRREDASARHERVRRKMCLTPWGAADQASTP